MHIYIFILFSIYIDLRNFWYLYLGNGLKLISINNQITMYISIFILVYIVKCY